MGVLGDFLIICLVTSAGALVSAIPGFPFPGTVTGMMIMVLLLLFRAVKVRRIERAADFLIRFLPLFFIPLIINIMKEYDLISRFGFKLLLIIFLTAVITMIITGLTAKALLSAAGKRNGENPDD